MTSMDEILGDLNSSLFGQASSKAAQLAESGLALFHDTSIAGPKNPGLYPAAMLLQAYALALQQRHDEAQAVIEREVGRLTFHPYAITNLLLEHHIALSTVISTIVAGQPLGTAGGMTRFETLIDRAASKAAKEDGWENDARVYLLRAQLRDAIVTEFGAGLVQQLTQTPLGALLAKLAEKRGYLETPVPSACYDMPQQSRR